MKKVIIRKANTARNGYTLVCGRITSGEIASLVDKSAPSSASIIKAGKPLDGVAALSAGAELAITLNATWVYPQEATDKAVGISADTERAKEALRHAQAELKIATDKATVSFSFSGREESERESYMIDATREESERVYSARSALAEVNERRKIANAEFDAAYLTALRKRREGRGVFDDDNVIA